MLGPLMGIAAGVMLAPAIKDQLIKSFPGLAKFGEGTGFGFDNAEANNKAWGELGNTINPFGDPFATGGLVTGGSVGRAVIPRGEDGLIGAREGEFMMRESAVRRIGIPTMRALNEGAPLAGVGGGGGGDIVIHNRTYLDSRVVAESTERVKRAKRARA
jgi:hypothetical protein